MFLCEACAAKEGIDKFSLWILPRSYGPCEDCGNTRSCGDVPSGWLKPKKSEEKKDG